MSTLSIQNFIVEGSIAALAGIGYMTYRKFHVPRVYEELAHTSFVKNSPIADCVMQLKTIDFNDSWLKLTHDIDYLLYLSNEPSASNAWLANRVVTTLRATTESIMENAKASRNLEILDKAVDIDRDTLPLLETMYEELIHNMLMPGE